MPHDFETRPVARLLWKARAAMENESGDKAVTHLMIVTAYCPVDADGETFDQAREDAEEAFECAAETLREMISDVQVDF